MPNFFPNSTCNQCSDCVVSANFFKKYCVHPAGADANFEQFCDNNCLKSSGTCVTKPPATAVVAGGGAARYGVFYLRVKKSFSLED